MQSLIRLGADLDAQLVYVVNHVADDALNVVVNQVMQ
jgi:hypothetical protein